MFSEEDLKKIIHDPEIRNFVPPKGQNYSLLPFLTREEIAKLPPDKKWLYDESRPDWYDKK